ncbi:hypothetical protein DAPPUDRAFT_236081 [Daphnia pulex]|uniref:Uncharacterized protein n=1 Tax=Daphnia pulex TaxID=6669 RepID=E9FZX2_DAPPU|nr:hypothetical protein DAPPUDRAFT_236081 [Daphnia pulex]|eukprot:EFX87123.1 hypothetical protein DAPPUDRAFT_236081 [Daphnia pulex]
MNDMNLIRYDESQRRNHRMIEKLNHQKTSQRRGSPSLIPVYYSSSQPSSTTAYKSVPRLTMIIDLTCPNEFISTY